MKEKVSYPIIEDMKRYVENFNENNYEKTGSETDKAVILYLRDYYNRHLPVGVTAWIRVNKPDERLIYGSGLGEQVCFVRDVICELLSSSYKEWEDIEPVVISTHRSKSVELPVFLIELKKYGFEMVLRYNFYDWKISVKSDKPLNFDYMGLFDPTLRIPSIYCEGFPESKVYGCYNENHSEFTIELNDKYQVYTFMFLLKTYLGIKKEK